MSMATRGHQLLVGYVVKRSSLQSVLIYIQFALNTEESMYVLLNLPLDVLFYEFI